MTTSLVRLQKALRRTGVTVERRQGVFELRNAHAQARVLLPDSLPLEERAVHQLLAFAAVRVPGSDGAVCRACATPDFHPRSVAPVGSIVATTPDLVIPAAIGTDINCGMRLVRTGLKLEAFHRDEHHLVARLTQSLLRGRRDVPVPAAAFRALFDLGPHPFLERIVRSGIWAAADLPRIASEVERCVGLDAFGAAARYAPEALMPSRELVRDPQLGTIGSGNHFISFEHVEAALDRKRAYDNAIKVGDVVLMIHSGSRDVGFYVGRRWMDRARDDWPRGLRHPASGLYGLSGPAATEYMLAMGAAARYAWLNRVALTELVRTELEALGAGGDLIVDVPHNIILREHGMNIHRKGTTPAHERGLALIPGSMGDASFLVEGLGNPEWLWSCSHGAGRSVRRQVLRAERKQAVESTSDWRCVTLREERRVEESPAAYKPVGAVVSSQEQAGLIRVICRLRPLITFKA